MGICASKNSSSDAVAKKGKRSKARKTRQVPQEGKSQNDVPVSYPGQFNESNLPYFSFLQEGNKLSVLAQRNPRCALPHVLRFVRFIS